MTKQYKAQRGRPPLEGDPMHQMAIRLPVDLISDLDSIIASRHGEGDRSGIIRELLRQAIADRKRKPRHDPLT